MCVCKEHRDEGYKSAYTAGFSPQRQEDFVNISVQEDETAHPIVQSISYLMNMFKETEECFLLIYWLAFGRVAIQITTLSHD